MLFHKAISLGVCHHMPIILLPLALILLFDVLNAQFEIFILNFILFQLGLQVLWLAITCGNSNFLELILKP